MDASPATEAMAKIVAALKKIRVQAVAIGDAAFAAQGVKRAAQNVELLSAAGEKYRLALAAAAKVEGLAPSEAPAGTLRFIWKSASVRILEASTPFHRLILSRAEPGVVLGTRSFVATPDDLILLRAGSEAQGDRESVIELMRIHAKKLDPGYLKERAESAGTFEKVKALWKEAKG